MFVPPPPQSVTRLATHKGLGGFLLYSIEYAYAHTLTYNTI